MVETLTKPYLVHFLQKQKYLSFCFQELESLAKLFSIPLETLYQGQGGKRPAINLATQPYIQVNLPSPQSASQIVKRSILIKEVIDVYGESKSLDDISKCIDTERLAPVSNLKFKFKVEGLGRTISTKEQIKVINSFDGTPLLAENVELLNPSVVFKVIHDTRNQRVFFGREVAEQRDSEGRTFFSKYNLDKRPYLGPTSTDHELAFLMANQACIQEGDLVYDPFVGSGSIALACSHFGANVLGSDLDQRVLRGYAVGRKTNNEQVLKMMEETKAVEAGTAEKHQMFNIFTNFRHYSLPCPQIVAQDIFKPMLRSQQPLLDAIVCDPPYGLRHRSKKLEGQNEFDVEAIYSQLLSVGAQLLKIGGRLVFLFHTDASLPAERNKFPQHPSFQLIDSSENDLTKARKRHLITMQRVE